MLEHEREEDDNNVERITGETHDDGERSREQEQTIDAGRKNLKQYRENKVSLFLFETEKVRSRRHEFSRLRLRKFVVRDER